MSISDNQPWADPNGPDFARYSQKDLDAAVAVERERCENIATTYLSAATENIHADRDFCCAMLRSSRDKIRSGE